MELCKPNVTYLGPSYVMHALTRRQGTAELEYPNSANVYHTIGDGLIALSHNPGYGKESNVALNLQAGRCAGFISDWQARGFLPRQQEKLCIGAKPSMTAQVTWHTGWQISWTDPSLDLWGHVQNNHLDSAQAPQTEHRHHGPWRDGGWVNPGK